MSMMDIIDIDMLQGRFVIIMYCGTAVHTDRFCPNSTPRLLPIDARLLSILPERRPHIVQKTLVREDSPGYCRKTLAGFDRRCVRCNRSSTLRKLLRVVLSV